MNDHRDVTELTLFLTAALASELTENIRAIAASERENHISLRFIYENGPSSEEIEIMSCVGTELLSNYSDKSGEERYEVIPAGIISLNKDEFWAYERGWKAC